MHRLGGIISYEVNTYLEYILCNEDGDIIVPSVTLVSVWCDMLWFVCVCVCAWVEAKISVPSTVP